MLRDFVKRILAPDIRRNVERLVRIHACFSGIVKTVERICYVLVAFRESKRMLGPWGP